MKIKIADNIRTLRKQHTLTQEQLAEALGVTVSAVYKWEAGHSVPEVKMLVELADLFEISVDTLLGYGRQNNNIKDRINRIEQYILERDFEEALLEANKNLQKYPNNFDVVYTAANVYMIIFYEKKDENAMQKAIELFYRAIPLLYQNEKSSINKTSIMNLIGNLYISAGQKEKGLEILKENNICGINNDNIGLTYAMMKQPDIAKPYLYQSGVAVLNSTIRTMFGMMLMYAEQKNELFIEVGVWLEKYLDIIVVEKQKVTFADKLKAILFAQFGVMLADIGKYDEAEKYITEAYEYALKFDAAPSYSPQDIIFFENEESFALLLDGMGETALEAIEGFAFAEAKNKATQDFIQAKREVLKNEGLLK